MRSARDAFAERGYHGATMADIAAGAGLAVQTVSYFFGSKPRLLADLIDAVVLGQIDDRADDSPDAAEWFRTSVSDPDGPAALGAFVDGTVRVLARASTVADAARVAALTDPDVEAVYRRSEGFRRSEYRRVVLSLADHHNLRADLDVEEATDVLTTLAGPQVYLAFAVDRGWSDAHVSAWLTATLARLLLSGNGDL